VTWRSYQKLSRQKEEIEVINHELQQKSEEIATQRDAIEGSYSELEKTHQQLKDTQGKLIAAEKMASLGQLTAGIAHEINNPINFVSSNINPLKMNIEEVKYIIQLIRDLPSSANIREDLNKIEAAVDKADLYTILEENDLLLNGIEEGARRTKEIVAGLRNFSRVDEDEWKMADVNEGILSTLMLLQNECKNKITIHKQLNALPKIECQPGKLNQVFMNLFTNAIQAIDANGDIYVSTLETRNEIKIEIKDTGVGIREEIRDRIFEPFFTTKEIGKGTGLGLAITYGIIEKHHGQISLESLPGHGTSFIISLPKRQPVISVHKNSKQIAN
jgi:signal transduction histidine kinase